MEKKLILVDMDGVLCRYDDALLKRAHERFGLPLYSGEDVKHFSTHKIFPKEYHASVEALANEEGFFKNLEPYPGVVEALNEMASDPRFNVLICTKPKRFEKNPCCAYEKVLWGDRVLGVGWSDRIILTRDKTLIYGDVLIDDIPKVKGNHTPSWIHVFHDRPYNRGIDKPRITDWGKWKEVLLPILYP